MLEASRVFAKLCWETPMNFRVLIIAAPIAAAIAGQAFAHHSFAMFDQTKAVTLKGTVKEFEWVNPHAWIRLLVMDAKTNKQVEYAFEMGSVARSTKDGWKRDMLKPGDVITVTMAPLKDGSRGGMYLAAELPNGKKMGRTGPAVGLPDPK
jgi:Family of unknown function (DUF6152)